MDTWEKIFELEKTAREIFKDAYAGMTISSKKTYTDVCFSVLEEGEEPERVIPEKFIGVLREKVLEMVNQCGKIVDVIHSNEAYYRVESLVNYIIEYFLKEAKQNAQVESDGEGTEGSPKD
jgi:hypothetical protein